jgi:hypothetical protein
MIGVGVAGARMEQDAQTVTIEHQPRQKEAATVDRAADTRLPRPNNKGELYRIFEDGVGIAFWKSGAKREAHLMPIPFTLSAFVAWAAPPQAWLAPFVCRAAPYDFGEVRVATLALLIFTALSR